MARTKVNISDLSDEPVNARVKVDPSEFTDDLLALPQAELPEMPKNTLAEFEQRVGGYKADDQERALADERLPALERRIVKAGFPEGSEKDPGDKGTPEQQAAHGKYNLYMAAKKREAERAKNSKISRPEAAVFTAAQGALGGWGGPIAAAEYGEEQMGMSGMSYLLNALGVGKAPTLPPTSEEIENVKKTVEQKTGEAHAAYPYQSAATGMLGAAVPFAAGTKLLGAAGLAPRLAQAATGGAYGLSTAAAAPAETAGDKIRNLLTSGVLGFAGGGAPALTGGALAGAGLAGTLSDSLAIPGITDTQESRNIAMGGAIPAVGGGIAGLISKRAGKTGAAQQSMLDEGIRKKATPLEKKQIDDYRVSEESIKSKQSAAKDLYVEAEKKAKAAYKSRKAAEGGFTRKALDRHVALIDEALKDPNITPEERVYWETFREESRADARNIAAAKKSPQEEAKGQAAEKWDPIIEIRENRKAKAAEAAKQAQQSPETLIETLAPDERAALVKAAEEQRLSEDFKRSSSVLPVGEEPMPFAEVQKGGVRKKLEGSVAKRAADLEAAKDSMVKERLRQWEPARVAVGPEAPQPLDTQLTQLAKLYSAAKASRARAKSAGQVEVPTTAISRLIPGVLQQSSRSQSNTSDEDVKRKIAELIAAQTRGE